MTRSRFTRRWVDRLRIQLDVDDVDHRLEKVAGGTHKFLGCHTIQALDSPHRCLDHLGIGRRLHAGQEERPLDHGAPARQLNR